MFSNGLGPPVKGPVNCQKGHDSLVENPDMGAHNARQRSSLPHLGAGDLELVICTSFQF